MPIHPPGKYSHFVDFPFVFKGKKKGAGRGKDEDATPNLKNPVIRAAARLGGGQEAVDGSTKQRSSHVQSDGSNPLSCTVTPPEAQKRNA